MRNDVMVQQLVAFATPFTVSGRPMNVPFVGAVITQGCFCNRHTPQKQRKVVRPSRRSPLASLVETSREYGTTIPDDTSVAVGRKPLPTVAVMHALLKIDPVRQFVMKIGRRKILNDARKLGIPWEQDVALLRSQLQSHIEPLRLQLENPALRDEKDLPDYYKVPFHGYPGGNLGLLAAFETEVSARTVHAVHCPENPLNGDATLRGNAVAILSARWDAVCGPTRGSPSRILDMGCSVGLGTALLAERFPKAQVVGVDACSLMLAVGALRRGAPQIEYMHALGEDLPGHFEESFDIVAIQLMLHELPDDVMRRMLAEARRVLRPGGMICVMDVDPSRLGDGIPAVVLTLFASTEPYLEVHARRDVEAEVARAGFTLLETKHNTKRHFTMTGFK